MSYSRAIDGADQCQEAQFVKGLIWTPTGERCIAEDMVKQARRAYLSDLEIGSRELDSELSRYLTVVLRLGNGEPIEFFDGRGHSAAAVIQEASKRRTKVELQSISTESPPQPEVHIACAIPKGERADWIVEKCSELGAHSISWIVCERSQDHRKDHSKRFSRWNKIAQEAARQSHNNWLPDFHGPLLLGDFVRQQTTKYLQLVLDTAGNTVPLSSIEVRHSKPIVLCIGPEGGFTADERQQFVEADWQVVSLGPSVLRLETAVIVGLGTIQNLSSSRETGES